MSNNFLSGIAQGAKYPKLNRANPVQGKTNFKERHHRRSDQSNTNELMLTPAMEAKMVERITASVVNALRDSIPVGVRN